MFQSELTDQLHEAWACRDVALAWRLARLLTGRSIGPKFRNYRVPLASRPERNEMVAELQAHPHQGGCSAEPSFELGSWLACLDEDEKLHWQLQLLLQQKEQVLGQ